ncbi:protein-tyrosine phosphatase-like protein [Lineolata rhizophorae]|uniref:protein-tyrosine-phosphatase n=1 Tax=Lineolata rhizophorae TaxID=578093 RepID=A0A6A6PEL2_9PEZI|nr:protein-tyrosine phosphatase-like protein [Lineolata rhizophorae]
MPSAHSRAQSAAEATTLSQPPAQVRGQVIEYIQDRLYLAAYDRPPSAKSPFPYPSRQSPKKRSSRAPQGPTPSSGPKVHPPVYFSVDDTLLYNAFHADFGPLHIGHLYRFAVQLHEVLGDPANEGRGVVFWSYFNPRSRANAACILACYMIMIQSWPPHLVLAPIAQMDPPCMPFRDAGYSQADYVLNIQDVVYGVWKAKEEGICSLRDFSLEEYEAFERVDMGDFNWITADFLAFASPQHEPTAVIPPHSPHYASLPKTIAEVARNEQLPLPFKNVLTHFVDRNVGLVVRLNSALYSPSYFTSLGIEHLDMIFDDGTCPPLELVRRFINLAHDMIYNKQRRIAVHCKAGLGRTGCLIGAYLIYRHGFTANEIIAFMRFMRPGMVVGPQQHWLHLNQGAFREWYWEDRMAAATKASISTALPSTPTRPETSRSKSQRLASATSATHTPPGSAKRSALGDITSHEQRSASGTYHPVADDYKPRNSSSSYVHVADDNLPAPTPGQPRKTSKAYGANHSPLRSSTTAGASATAVDENERPEAEIVSFETRRARQAAAGDESDEEFQLRMLARHHHTRNGRGSRSPVSSHHHGLQQASPTKGAAAAEAANKRRAVSCTTTTLTTSVARWSVEPSEDSDVENQFVGVIPATPSVTEAKKISGKGDLSVGKVRGSPTRRSGENGRVATGVRKTSGRVGSAGNKGL